MIFMIFTIVGGLMTVAGLIGIWIFIIRAQRLRKTEQSPEAVHVELRKLVFLNTLSVGVGFLGLALLTVGLILG